MDTPNDPKLTDDAFVLNVKTHRDVVALRQRLEGHIFHSTFSGVDKRNKKFTLLQRAYEPYTVNGAVRTKKNCGWIGIQEETYRKEVEDLIKSSQSELPE